MRHTDILIVGQGIAGTLLSYELMRAGKSVLVLDQPTGHQASLVASAVLNPLIGKSWTVAKDAEMLIPLAARTYRLLEQILDAALLSEKSLLVFHRHEEDAANFEQQTRTGNPYIALPCEDTIEQLKLQWIIPRSIGQVTPVFTIDAALLLSKWKQYLQSRASFIEEQFLYNGLSLAAGKLVYKDIRADKIVFCEGATGRKNPFFPVQNFTANRGDALILSIPGLATGSIYQRGIRLVPKSDGLFWCGSNYTWKYETLNPDLGWQKETLIELESWLKLPFELVSHLVAERPTTAGQVPILAQHAEYTNMFCFNGLGTRGFSAGPYLAGQMAAMVTS
jgi:glycine/D-amino acid oxidase-like deaminating enzyme